MTTTNARQYLESLNLSDMQEEMTEHTGYVCDAIAEIADSNVSIYYSDQDDFANENPELMRDAVAEGLALDGREYFTANPDDDYQDYTRHIARCAWFMGNEQEIYKDLDDVLLYVAISHLWSVYGEELETEGVEAVEALAFDNNDRIEDIQEEAEDAYRAATDPEEDED